MTMTRLAFLGTVICHGCYEEAGTKEVLYMTPQELYKENTGEDGPPPEVVKTPENSTWRCSVHQNTATANLSHMGKVCESVDEYE